ncbi:hypothetical protein CRM22_003979 [Opisthorchis felineus]|uniref:Uncharacterized protein n=1 Tax=Opisthorchis felineus TaxID=147828 RepID=A0A4S2M3R9_OPIFE|nr:hypothetical protein CRM22_003979 [Opisthorchis felineus]TGZ69009.1 hypothetical protein CRM22_003979 [Opisthorchis felineus]TGZ69010.1 hypothetical protein CRM22_003979 [Opisthorchis felineus]
MMTLLDYMTSIRPSNSFMRKLIVATEELDPFIDKYFGKEDIRIVNWNESAYEEELIERIRSPRQSYAVTLAIDFQPTPRRLRRIRAILEKSGTLVIPHELPEWRTRYPDLMQSFTKDGGRFIKLFETMSTTSRTRELEFRLQAGRAGCRRLYSFTDNMDDRAR